MTNFTPGPHLLIDHRGGATLNDAAALEAAMRRAVDVTGTAVLSAVFHDLPDGVSGALVLHTGHLCVRSWPDHGYAAFDVFIPGEGMGKKVADELAHALLPDWTQIRSVTRNDFTPTVS